MVLNIYLFMQLTGYQIFISFGNNWKLFPSQHFMTKHMTQDGKYADF